MKKISALILCVILVFSSIPFAVSAADELKITVASDLHLDLEYCKAESVELTNPIGGDYAFAIDGGQMHYESEAVIDAFLERAAKENTEYLLITGDSTHSGTEQEHRYMAEKFKQFEEKSGKQVFIIPGNHDYYYGNTNPDQFKQYYADFGYNEAITVDENTASYVVDLNDEYRLLAIDSCKPVEIGHGVDAQLMSWIMTQGEKAKAEGKKMIAMLHHNFIEHVYLSNALSGSFVIPEKEADLKNLFAELDIKYVFTGHTHGQDIASYENEDGKVIYSVLTGSINAYPCPYRNISFGNKVKITTEFIDSIDTSKLPAGIPENALNEAKTNFPQYAKNYTYVGFEYRLYIFTTAEKLSSFVEDEEMKELINKVGGRLEKAVNMPLYEKDAVVPGESIESVAKKYNTTLPETEHKTILKLLTYFYLTNSQGDEKISPYSADAIVLSRAVAAGINYTLSQVSDAEYAQALSFVFEMLGVNIPVDFLKYAGSGIKRFEGCEILVTTALLPIIGNFGTDTAPADNNVTLPGYSQIVEGEQNGFVTFLEIIKKLIEFVMTLFALLP